MSLEQATLAFVQAAVDEIVDDCIAIAKETHIGQPVWPGYWTVNADNMRRAIVKRLEDYKTGAGERTAQRTAA